MNTAQYFSSTPVLSGNMAIFAGTSAGLMWALMFTASYLTASHADHSDTQRNFSACLTCFCHAVHLHLSQRTFLVQNLAPTEKLFRRCSGRSVEEADKSQTYIQNNSATCGSGGFRELDNVMCHIAKYHDAQRFTVCFEIFCYAMSVNEQEASNHGWVSLTSQWTSRKI